MGDRPRRVARLPEPVGGLGVGQPSAPLPLVRAQGAGAVSQPLPHLVGLCPVHLGEFWVPLEPKTGEATCPACDRRMLIYAPRAAGAAERPCERCGNPLGAGGHGPGFCIDRRAA